MTIKYKVWLEIEEIDESRDHYQTVETPGDAVATFDTYESARDFVLWADALLTDGGHPLLHEVDLVDACKRAIQCLNAIPNTCTHVGRSYDVVVQLERAIRAAVENAQCSHPRVPLSAAYRRSLQRVIDYLADEDLHFEHCESDAERASHIWHDRQCLRTMLICGTPTPS